MTSAPEAEALYTVNSLAEYLQVSASFVYKLTSQRQIAHYKIGSEVRFSQAHVDSYLQARQQVPGPRSLPRQQPRRGRRRATIDSL